MPTSKKEKKWFAELKTSLETEHGRPFADHEVEKVADFLQTLARLQVDAYLEDERRQERLRESPGGFHLDTPGYTCRICRAPTSSGDSWFDEHGLKCMACQNAINQKIIPPTVATDPDSYYTAQELEQNFALTTRIRRQWIRKGRLISRTITRFDKRPGKYPDLELFLIGDNAALLPPKHLVQSRMTKETIDGQEWHTSRPWYYVVDPKEHLKGYKIMEYLTFVPEPPPAPG
jgi:hypothetical protein